MKLEKDLGIKAAHALLWNTLLKDREFYGNSFNEHINVHGQIWSFFSADLKMIIHIQEEKLRNDHNPLKKEIIQAVKNDGITIVLLSPRQVLDEYSSSIDHITEVYLENNQNQCGV